MIGGEGKGTPFCSRAAEVSPDFRAGVMIRNQFYLDWEDNRRMTQIGTGDTDAKGERHCGGATGDWNLGWEQALLNVKCVWGKAVLCGEESISARGRYQIKVLFECGRGMEAR